MTRSKKGFTLVETLVAITVLAVIMIPASMVLMEYARAAGRDDDVAKAANLARRELAIVNNTAFASVNNATYNNYAGYPFTVQRTVTTPAGGSADLKSVKIAVSRSGSAERLFGLATYVVNGVSFGLGSAVPVGGQAGYFTGAKISYVSGTRTLTVRMQNTSASDTITVTNIRMSAVSQSNRRLSRVTMGGAIKFNGNWTIPRTTPASVGLSSSYVMAPGTNSTNNTFVFGTNMNTAITVIYVFSDSTEATVTYAIP